MIQIRRALTLAILLAAAGRSSAEAQTVVYAPGPVVAPTGPTVVYAPAAPVATTAGSYYAAPSRRELRRANQYNTLRPIYGRRPVVTFAPYSDRYFPTANAPLPATTTYSAVPQPTYYAVPGR